MKHASVDLRDLELKRIEHLNGTRFLKLFASNLTYWELLMTIYNLNGDVGFGINDYIDRLTTLRSTRLTVQNFIKDRISEGALEVIPSAKKSRKTLVVGALLAQELQEFFQWQITHGTHWNGDLQSEPQDGLMQVGQR